MKKSLFICSVLLGSAWMASCGENDVHELWVGYPNGISTLYADDTQDSIGFYTYDSWRVTPMASWISMVGNNSGNLVHDNFKRYYVCTELKMERNTTGRSRLGTVLVSSYDYQASGIYLQLGTLNISHPQYTIKNFLQNTYLPDSVAYAINDSSFVTADSICFNVKQSWTLAFKDGQQPQWVKLSSTQGYAGKNQVDLTVEENPDTTARTTTLVLQSGGICNEIDIRQLGLKLKTDDEQQQK